MNALNRLTQDILTDLKTPANSKTTAYAYGNTGNRTTKTETQGTTVTTTGYAYDADDRLTSETKTTGTAVSTTTYQWDANGNLTQKVEPTQTTLYTWDSNNRLQSVARGATAATATTIATYQYDADGNRVGKTLADGTKISYLVDSNMSYAQVAEETSTTTSTTATSTTDYLYGLERIQQTRAGQGTYYLDDGLGSTRLLTDATGNVTDSYDFDDYGALQAQTGATKNDFLFAGEQFDQEAGLYYNRARYLDVNTGRFVGLDPFQGKLSQPITLNKYTYAGNNPVSKTDPSGEVTLGQFGTAVAVGGVLSGVADVMANNAFGRPQSLGEIISASVTGAIVTGASVALPVIGVVAGTAGVIGSSVLLKTVFENPDSTYYQKAEACALVFASIAGLSYGLSYYRLTGGARARFVNARDVPLTEGPKFPLNLRSPDDIVLESEQNTLRKHRLSPPKGVVVR